MILHKIKNNLSVDERHLFINLVDEILFDRNVEKEERLDLLINLMMKARCTKNEMFIFLEPGKNEK